MPLKPATLLTLLLINSAASAGNLPGESIDSLAQKSEIIVVGEIVDIQPAGTGLLPPRNFPILHQRATIEVLRAINTADAKPLKLDEIVLDYLDFDPAKPTSIIDGPYLPSFMLQNPPLRVGTVAIFPVKRDHTPTTQPNSQPATPPTPLYRFVSEEGIGLILPAIKEPLNEKPPASAKDFLYQELASNLVHGNFRDIARGAGYIDSMSWHSTNFKTPVLPLLESEIHDEGRWLEIAVAAHCSLAQPRILFSDLHRGIKSDHDDFLLVQLALSKTSPQNLDERLLRSMVSHQDTLEFRPGLATSLQDNYGSNPLLLELERAALAAAKPGSLEMACALIKDPSHPLAAPAITAARKALTAPIKKHDSAFTSAIFLLIRIGSADDFSFLLDQARQSQKDSPLIFQAFLVDAFATNDGPANARILELCRRYIDLQSPLLFDFPSSPFPVPTTFGDLRICDQAGLIAQALSRQSFGLKRNDPLESRNQALEKIRTWLKP